MIEGVEWLFLMAFVVVSLYCLYLVLSAQPDMSIRDTRGVNTDYVAAQIFMDMVTQARHSIVIHDDGNDMPGSIYNNDDVIEVVRRQVKKYPELEIQCWFNNKDDIKLLQLIDGENRANFKVWYTEGSRPPQDIHYKIVDQGAIVYLSRHRHGERESGYTLRKVGTSWFSKRTREKISKPYVENFKFGISHAKPRTTY